ncbi:MAG: serine/threonine protein kinase [Sandaracinaceae bacterium]|nr:serine/threonine protein kinase [Sandaracinaceae bacterium]
MNARIGSVIAGKYRLNRLLGTGAIGAVYAALHQFTGKHVALKMIDASFGEHEGFGVRFLREARAAADIDHPAICDVLDAGREPDGSLYLALELLEGRTLDDAIETNDLRLDEIVEVIAQVLDGIAAAHDRAIVHRDIKPGNIFLTWDAHGELRAKIIDFGVAKRTNSGPEMFTTQQGAILGTPYYMAPEQAAGDPIDNRADIWAVGAVLFHALTGEPPFDEETYNRLIARLMNEDARSLREVRKDLPDWLVTAVDGALKRDPADRWQSARTMRDVLKSQGKAPIELDWEVHEDATVRTEGLFGGEQERPATIRLLGKGEPSEPSIEVDLDPPEEPIAPPSIPDIAYDASGGHTVRSVIPPAFQEAEPAKKKGSGLWLGVLLGALVMGVLMLGVGWAVLAALGP